MSRPGESSKQQAIQIKVKGKLDQSWSEWFGGMVIDLESSDGHSAITTLTGTVSDQSTLRGILNRIWDLNLKIVSVETVELCDEDEA